MVFGPAEIWIGAARRVRPWRGTNCFMDLRSRPCARDNSIPEDDIPADTLMNHHDDVESPAFTVGMVITPDCDKVTLLFE